MSWNRKQIILHRFMNPARSRNGIRCNSVVTTLLAEAFAFLHFAATLCAISVFQFPFTLVLNSLGEFGSSPIG